MIPFNLKEQFFRHTSTLGGPFFYIFILIFLLTINQYNLALKLFLAFILAYIIASPLRLIFFKERSKKQPFSGILGKINSSSFPSLHSTRSTLLVLFAFYNLNLLASCFILVLALIVYYSRLHLKSHYALDIFAGIILGVVDFYIITLI